MARKPHPDKQFQLLHVLLPMHLLSGLKTTPEGRPATSSIAFEASSILAEHEQRLLPSQRVEYYAKDKPSAPSELSVPISLTRTGLPRIIPPTHRKVIRQRSERSDMLVRLSLSTLASISSPALDIVRVVYSALVMLSSTQSLLERYIPEIQAAEEKGRCKAVRHYAVVNLKIWSRYRTGVRVSCGISFSQSLAFSRVCLFVYLLEHWSIPVFSQSSQCAPSKPVNLSSGE